MAQKKVVAKKRIPSAQKRAAQSEKRRLMHVARRSELKTMTKKVLSALAQNDLILASDLLRQTEAKIARACGKGTLKPSTASRKVSALAKKVYAAGKQAGVSPLL